MRDKSEAIINHFSHEHPLHLTNPQLSKTCSACKQTLETEPLYTCKSPSCTTFTLHLKCTQLPHRITHPCHHNHPLSLLPNPGFACNACGNRGDGFAYCCKDCGINIHTMCAKLPLSLSHMSHVHQLGFVFTPPYASNRFSCDVCGVIEGRKCWLYRCGLCRFDAHLGCATSSKPQAVARSVAYDHNLFMNQINDQRNQFFQNLIMGYGGGGNMNSQILQAMMGGGGGGGGMNNQILQAMMGGGGGGGINNQILQGLMGSGGGGGSNQLLQAFMGGGGGGGGGGGLDLSSVLGNVGDIGGLMGGLGGFGF